jgi:alcohol dehydrogenase
MAKKVKFSVIPKLISDGKPLEKISSELSVWGASRPFLITDKNYKSSGVLKKIIRSLKKSGISIGAHHAEAGYNADLKEIKLLAQKFWTSNCDSIIAAGSGSVMDIARGVNIIASTGSENIIKFSGNKKIPCRLKPFVSIPLPLLRGTETSNMAVIDGVKYYSDFLYPDIIVTDSKLSALAPKETILESALSILAVSLDSALSPKGNPVRNSYLYKAITPICESLEKMHIKPGNKKIKSDLVNAAAVAGMACDSSYTGFITSAALALSRETGLSFGTAAGIMMPHAIEYMYRNHGPHDSGILLAVAGQQIFTITPEKQRGEVTAVMIESWIDGYGSTIPKNLKKIKFPDYRLQELSDNAEFLCGGIYKSSEFFSVFTGALQGKVKLQEKEKTSFDLNKIINNTFGLDDK